MKSVTVTGSNLYRVALDQLGDSTQWNRIAQLNGLIDPELTGINTLLIPSIDATATGGVYVP